jgi:hypothetical protein
MVQHILFTGRAALMSYSSGKAVWLNGEKVVQDMQKESWEVLNIHIWTENEILSSAMTSEKDTPSKRDTWLLGTANKKKDPADRQTHLPDSDKRSKTVLGFRFYFTFRTQNPPRELKDSTVDVSELQGAFIT